MHAEDLLSKDQLKALKEKEGLKSKKPATRRDIKILIKRIDDLEDWLSCVVNKLLKNKIIK